MIWRRAFCVFGGAYILVILAFALLLPPHNAYYVSIDNRLIQPSPLYLFGTDDLGRNMFSRFVEGSKFTLFIGLLTTLLAGAVGYTMKKLVQVMPRWFGRLVMVFAYICFVVPSFLLAPRWPNRLLTTVVCICAILPLAFLALIIVTSAELTGWSTTLVLGPLWGIGVAYVLNRDHLPYAPTALMVSVFAWAIFQHAALDIIGLGVQPPEPSWGSMFVAQTTSWLPQAAALLSFSVVGALAFMLSDIVLRKS